MFNPDPSGIMKILKKYAEWALWMEFEKKSIHFPQLKIESFDFRREWWPREAVYRLLVFQKEKDWTRITDVKGCSGKLWCSSENKMDPTPWITFNYLKGSWLSVLGGTLNTSEIVKNCRSFAWSLKDIQFLKQ